MRRWSLLLRKTVANIEGKWGLLGIESAIVLNEKDIIVKAMIIRKMIKEEIDQETIVEGQQVEIIDAEANLEACRQKTFKVSSYICLTH
jgi:hypothetical protein